MKNGMFIWHPIGEAKKLFTNFIIFLLDSNRRTIKQLDYYNLKFKKTNILNKINCAKFASQKCPISLFFPVAICL